MVARINTVAFHGVDVQSVDVQVQISSGMPAFTIAGYKRPIIIILFLIFILLPTLIHAAERENECPLFGAEYVPQNLVLEDLYQEPYPTLKPNRTLSFVLLIEKGDKGGAIRNIFLNFDAYNKAGKKVSTMRFGDAWSNGLSRQGFSTYWGMYCSFEKKDESDCADMKPSVHFYPIGVNKDLTPASLKQAPYLLIFNGTYPALHYTSYQVPEHWNKYIKFYDEDRIYPDFRGYDFWIRSRCGEPEKEME